ncbi:TOM1-like protein 5 [Impatiens glandulifera]|uniref:TOM1-like protein 5 n=1 Tax=Impatiens glandulifera TaxID=253017 RepID=UPI001FB15587|nr:TOM1-like protein 5 [Impatiens glandulifera]XP_047310814.1 TOM1-like protein 5 [Impatiens glandulifera]XP_047310815.1 TOM1-like protein 5 [Impatiens glandulifera]
MATELVNSATSEKLPEMDWTRSIEICELISRDQRQAREVIKAIKKRLGNKNANVQLFAVMLLEILTNNLGDEVHKQVIDVGILPLLVKIVKKKSDLPVREKIFLLLDATQTATGGASGKFPQYYEAYYDLVNAGVKFPDRAPQVVSVAVSNQVSSNNKKHSSSNLHGDDGIPPPAKPLPEVVPESSIVEKASAALEVLREVLDAVDPHHPEGAKDEFTLDLVEQCSFQQQRVMHLAVTSRDDKVVSRAIDLNEQLQKLLARHDELISGKITSSSNHSTHEDADEEEVEQLVRRMRKGKACMQPEEEEEHRQQKDHRPFGLLGGHNINRPIIRPLSIDEPQEQQPLPIRQGVSIPPPPAKHVEREKFFQEKKVDGSGLANHVRGLSLHSRNGSSGGGSVNSD